MARRKVVALRNWQRCYWHGDFVRLLEDNGVEITGVVRSVNAVFGWLDSEQIPVVRALPEVAALNDDYPYLDQVGD